MDRKLSRMEVYNRLYKRVSDMLKNNVIGSDISKISDGIISRRANRFAVKNTDYYFYHQDEIERFSVI